MRKFILAALLCAAGSAMADYVASNDAGDELRLMNGACDHQDILDQLKPEFHSQFKRAQATIGGAVVRGCWIEIEEEKAFYVQFENGQGNVFPMGMFKETGI
jgi:hypothetical protein